MKYILFDFFGVLSTSAYLSVIQREVPSHLQEYYINLVSDLDKGNISEEELITKISEISGIDKISLWNEVLGEPKLNYDLLDYIESNLISNYEVGLLTNATQSIIDRILGNYQTLFLKKYISSEIKLAKPSREIFEYVLKDLDVLPREILFIDDNETNIEAAQSLGYNVHRFIRNDELIKFLSSSISKI